MKAFTTLALPFLLVGSALAAARPIKQVTCTEFDSAKYPGSRWVDEGALSNDAANTRTEDVYRSLVAKVAQHEKFRGEKSYTVTAGIWAPNGWKNNHRMFAKVERSSGNGEGQLFRVNFWDAKINFKKLHSYVLYPNEECSIESSIQKAGLGKITVESLY